MEPSSKKPNRTNKENRIQSPYHRETNKKRITSNIEAIRFLFLLF